MNQLFLQFLVRLHTLISRDEGQDLVEYALLVGLIALGAVLSFRNLLIAVEMSGVKIYSALTAAAQ